MEAVVRDETLWLAQKAMAQLFGVQVPAISKHLKNIYAEGELLESTTISKMETVVQRGFRGGVEEMVDFYNLDAIISVGYRVNSAKATQFRIWATMDKTSSDRLSLVHLMDHGLGMAQRGAVHLTGELLEYVEKNF